MNMKRSLHIIAILAILVLAACSRDDDFVAPAFLHVEAIKVVPPASNPITLNEGFYTSDITSCYVTAHYPGSNHLDTIGLFELPFTVPLLHSGEIDYFEFFPAVKISGIAGTQPYYKFYEPIKISKHNFHYGDTTYTDTLFTRSGDTLRFDTLATTYALTLSNVLVYEFFEPTSSSILFDSVIWHKHAPDEACTGLGYASVHVPDSVSNVPFYLRQDFYVNNPNLNLYLELDSRSDIRFEVYMEAAYTTGGNTDIQRVMVVNPSEHWQHLYINLGRTWQWFNHASNFRLSFAALNVGGVEGDIRIDNVKVITIL